MAYVDQDMRQWPDEKLHHFIADMVVPWYINFFMCWNECPDKLLVDYVQATQDTHQTLKNIGTFVGLNWNDAEIDVAITAAGVKGTRKNKAVAGRGETLDESIKNKIRSLAAYYKDQGVDFSRIGL